MSLSHVHLTPELIQAVRDAVDIVAVASEHTRLKKGGKNWEGLCPLHKEKTPSFSVDPAKGVFYCFGCGVGGDAIKLHMLLSGDEFPEAIETLARRYGIPLPSRKQSERRGPDLQGVLEEAAAFFTEQLNRSPLPQRYLHQRRIPPELVERFGLGYAPDAWDRLLSALSPRFSVQQLAAAGLVARSERSGKHYDRFRHRLIFPIHSPTGRIVGFGGRTLGDDKAKYINTAETERFQKSHLLYGLHQARRAIRDGGRAVLVEGYFDVVAAVASGVDWAVANMGTSLTQEQARLLCRYAEEVVVGYDGDTAGETAFHRSLPLLLAQGATVFRARFGVGEDPDSLRLAAGEEAVARAIEQAQDGVILRIEELTPPGTTAEPQRQAKAATTIAALLKPIQDEVLRFGYTRRAAQRLDLPVDLLLQKMGHGASRSGPQKATDSPPGAPRKVTGMEEKALEAFLVGDLRLPSVDELPPEEIFFDEGCRNIYRTFRALYKRGSGQRPQPRALLEALDGQPALVDRVAQIMVRGPSALDEGGLSDLFDTLKRRWVKKRLPELVSEIREAERRNDWDRVAELGRQKMELSRSLQLGFR